jgi:hypothetical protein
MKNDRNFNGKQVYVALRPELGKLMGRAIHNEHITVEYMGDDVSYNEVSNAALFWHHTFGLDHNKYVQVHVNGYANWYSHSRFYNVALIEFPDAPYLNYKKNWHLTLEKSELALEPIMLEKWDIENLYDNCYQLWIGYDDEEGNQQWLEVTGNLPNPERRLNLLSGISTKEL